MLLARSNRVNSCIYAARPEVSSRRRPKTTPRPAFYAKDPVLPGFFGFSQKKPEKSASFKNLLKIKNEML
jgi:hypothetical protein